SYDVPYVQTTVTEETYDDQGVLLQSALWTYQFNELGNPLVITDPLGNQTVYVRDSRMNITRMEIWEDQGGPDLILVYAEEKTLGRTTPRAPRRPSFDCGGGRAHWSSGVRARRSVPAPSP
ncbi:MAG: hypothetical protein ACE5JI_13255, partial [Acidobacteriota bacterium]